MKIGEWGELLAGIAAVIGVLWYVVALISKASSSATKLEALGKIVDELSKEKKDDAEKIVKMETQLDSLMESFRFHKRRDFDE